MEIDPSARAYAKLLTETLRWTMGGLSSSSCSLGGRGRTNENNHSQVFFLLPEVLSLLHDAPGAPYRTLFTPVGWWDLKCPCLRYTVMPSSFLVIKEGERPALLHLYGEFYGWAYAVQAMYEPPFLRMQHVSSTYYLHNLKIPCISWRPLQRQGSPPSLFIEITAIAEVGR